MTVEQKRFFLVATIILVAVFFVSEAFFLTILKPFWFHSRIISIILVWIVTCASHFWLMKTVTDTPNAFNRVFMLQTTLKLFIYMVFVAICLKLFGQDGYGAPLVVHFFVVYIIFAIFEVSMILKFVRDKSGEKTGSVKK